MEEAALGKKITTVRESLGLTVQQLAERSRCDVKLIERIERGEVVPSLAPLIAITRALGVRLGTLLDDATGLGPVVTRRDRPAGVERLHALDTSAGPGAGTLEFFSLAAGKAARHMEPFFIKVNPGPGGDLSSHEGEEVLFVLSGGIEVAYGSDVHVLGPGDSIYYDSIVPHRVRAAGAEPAQIVAVVYAPV